MSRGERLIKLSYSWFSMKPILVGKYFLLLPIKVLIKECRVKLLYIDNGVEHRRPFKETNKPIISKKILFSFHVLRYENKRETAQNGV